MQSSMPNTYIDIVSALRTMTDDYIATGFAETVAHSKDILLHAPSVSKYLRAVGKELKRPVVFVETWSTRAMVKFTKAQYMMPLAVGPIMVAESKAISTVNEFGVVNQIVHIRTHATIFEFNMHIEFYHQWKQSVLNDPACRKALKLSPLLQEVTAHVA